MSKILWCKNSKVCFMRQFFILNLMIILERNIIFMWFLIKKTIFEHRCRLMVLFLKSLKKKFEAVFFCF